MKKCLIIPDFFKGTLTSPEVCEIMKIRPAEAFPDSMIAAVPAADGGEGTIDCFLHALGGEKIARTVKGPRRTDVRSFYGIIGDCYKTRGGESKQV